MYFQVATSPGKEHFWLRDFSGPGGKTRFTIELLKMSIYIYTYVDWGPEVEHSVSSSRRENRAFIARLITGRRSAWKDFVQNRKCQTELAQQVGETGKEK